MSEKILGDGDIPMGVINNEVELANSSEDIFSPPPSRPVSPRVVGSGKGGMRSREDTVDYASSNELKTVPTSSKIPGIRMKTNDLYDRSQNHSLDDVSPSSGLPGLGTSMDAITPPTSTKDSVSGGGKIGGFPKSSGSKRSSVKRQLTASPINRVSNGEEMKSMEFSKSRGLADVDAPPPTDADIQSVRSFNENGKVSISNSSLNTSKIQGSIANERVSSNSHLLGSSSLPYNSSKNTDKMSGSYVEQLNRTLSAMESSKPIRLNQCHDFAWSRTLWASAARTCFRASCILTGVYMLSFWYFLGHLDGRVGVDPWYLLAATITTVGLGDISPSSQLSRGCAIIILPYGLTVLAMWYSYLTMLQRATKPKLPSDDVDSDDDDEEEEDDDGGYGTQSTKLETFLAAFGVTGKVRRDFMKKYLSCLISQKTNKDAALSPGQGEEDDNSSNGGKEGGGSNSQEVSLIKLEESHKENMALKKVKNVETKAEKNHRKLEERAALEQQGGKLRTVFFMCLKFVIILFVGAVVFHSDDGQNFLDKALANGLNQDYVGRTMVDALYFASIVVTGVGYGHVLVPVTRDAKVFCVFYFFISTAMVGKIIQDIIQLYVDDTVGESISKQIISSTIWVHRSDLDKDGRVSEADYLLFKLQQMQKVDHDVLNRLVKRFEQLDDNASRTLDVGVEIPSAEQVAEMVLEKQAMEEYQQSLLGLSNQSKTSSTSHPSKADSEKDDSLSRHKEAFSATVEQAKPSPFDDIWSKLHSKKVKAVPTLAELWQQRQKAEEERKRKENRDRLLKNAEEAKEGKVATKLRTFKPGAKLKQATIMTKLNECHDFAWSRALWKEAALTTFRVAFGLLACYLVLAYYLLTYTQPDMFGRSGVTPWYFLITTLTTVGYGDYAPTEQFNRACTIVLIPMGMVCITFALSFISAHANSKMPPASKQRMGKERHWAATTVQAIWRGKKVRAELSGEPTPPSPAQIAKSKEKPPPPPWYVKLWRYFDDQEVDAITKDLLEEMEEDDFEESNCTKLLQRLHNMAATVFNALYPTTILAQAFTLLLKFLVVITIGAVFMKTYNGETENQSITWIDAFYFATVTSTSVGYGDIVAASDGTEWFLVFYMLFATVTVLDVLGSAVELYIEGYVGEKIINEIIDSTVYVHKSDLDKDGKVSEADYVLFKLQQMQKVDPEVMDKLITRFRLLDLDDTRYLEVGKEIPSSDQVLEMQDIQLDEFDSQKDVTPLQVLWEIKRKEIKEKPFVVSSMENTTNADTQSEEMDSRNSLVTSKPAAATNADTKPTSDVTMRQSEESFKPKKKPPAPRQFRGKVEDV